MSLPRGVFASQVSMALGFLKKIELWFSSPPNPDYSTLQPSAFRNAGLRDLWDGVYREKMFDVALVDGSLFQFVNNVSAGEYKFIFMRCPYVYSSNFDGFPFDERFTGLSGDDVTILQAPEYLRYDYQPRLYTKLRHSAAHLHFKIDDGFRIPTSHMFYPMTFVLFVVRHLYPDRWDLILKTPALRLRTRYFRAKLPTVPASYWTLADQEDLYIC